VPINGDPFVTASPAHRYLPQRRAPPLFDPRKGAGMIINPKLQSAPFYPSGPARTGQKEKRRSDLGMRLDCC
jgi:hypothetical protein